MRQLNEDTDNTQRLKDTTKRRDWMATGELKFGQFCIIFIYEEMIDHPILYRA
jgi:hypothetical protein